MKTYEFTINSISSTSDDFNKISSIAMQAGKGACGLTSICGMKVEIYVDGKHSDAVRVWNALKNNGYLIVWRDSYEYIRN